MCAIDFASGTPRLLAGSPINETGTAIGIAVHPSQRFVYVADENQHVDTYRIRGDGTLPAQRDSSVSTPDTLIGIALDPKGRFAYAASNQGRAVYTFEIDPVTGALNQVGDPLFVGSPPDHSAPEYIAADPTGHFVYLSQVGFGIRGYGIDRATGALTELTGSPFAATGLPDGGILFGGAIAFKPSGDFLYTAGGGLNAFSIDGASGKLTLVDGSPFSLDIQSDPNAPNIAIDPQGQYLYATNFSLTRHVSGFSINQTTGALREVPASPLVSSSPYSIAVDSTGGFVFVGIDGPELGVYSVARSTGAFTELGASPFPFGGLESKVVFATLP